MVPPYYQVAMLESRTDSNDSSRHNDLYDIPLSSFPHLMDSLDEDEMDAIFSSPHFTLNRKSRSFPSYEPADRNSHEPAAQRGLKNISPSDGTSSTASSLDADDTHFLSVTVPE